MDRLLDHIHNAHIAVRKDKTNNGLTAMHFAARHGHFHIVSRLLRVSPALLDVADNAGKTALHYAAEAGSGDVVALLASQSTDAIVATTLDGRTALHLAVNSCQVEMVEQLLSLRPELLDMADQFGATATTLAAKHGVQTIKAALSSFAHREERSLRFAVQQCHDERVMELLDRRPELIDSVDPDGHTALYYACDEGNCELVEELLTYNPGWIEPACVWAALGAKGEEILKSLITSRPELARLVDDQGNTLLHRVMGFRIDKELFSEAVVLKVLSLAPESVHALNQFSKTPLAVALLHGNAFAVDELRWKLTLDEVMRTFFTCQINEPGSVRALVIRQCHTLAELLPAVVMEIVKNYLWAVVPTPFLNFTAQHKRKRTNCAASLFGESDYLEW